MPYSVRSIPAVPENRTKFVGHLVQSVLADGIYKRCMPPQLAKLRSLDRVLGNEGQECWAIMVSPTFNNYEIAK
jgi:hypothetical protein